MALGSLINRLLAPLGLRLHRRPSGLGRTGLSRQGEEAVIQDLIQGLEIEPYFVDVGAGDGAKDSNTARLALGGNRTDVPGLTPRTAYQNGYVDRPDRKKRFPWNRDVEVALTLSAEEALGFFRRLYAPYEGSYDLRIADDDS